MNAVHAFVAREALGKTSANAAQVAPDVDTASKAARPVLQPVDGNPLMVRAVQVCAGGRTPRRRAV
ncbi:MAG: hypothetical protein IT366_02905 [Candidatus Hydrogenedentes bacterium]|nr:hypothetical protein [Candidatus Hydrogenedentota bacterium]